jgi:serine/alanine adding enzyme
MTRVRRLGRNRYNTPPMKIEALTHPGPEWDQFAESHPESRLGHAAAWATVLSDAYGLEPKFLTARDDEGCVAGILPLVVFRSRPGGRKRLISLPYLDAAGILASNAQAAEALFDHALELVTTCDCDALELRGPTLPDGAAQRGTPHAGRVNLAMTLQVDPEAQWNALRAKVRNQTRKAEREGLSLADGTPSSLLDEFYRPFQVNMRDLGSPVHSAAFFRAASREFGERLRFIVTRDERGPMGGLVAIRYGNRVTVPWASTLRSERKRCPNNQIYWEAIRWAVASGAKTFDFGRSPIEGGTYRFKKGWGASDEPLFWFTFFGGGASPPSLESTPSPLVARLSRAWTRLPVPVASLIGARIRRYFSN